MTKNNYKPRAQKWFNFLLRYTYGIYLKTYFKISTTGLKEIKALKPPYVIVPNHMGVLDPFIVNAFIHHPVHWVTSDGYMRSRLMKTLLSLVGSIPKSKSIPDMVTIGWIVEIIRKHKGVVGVFAEGQSSWDGHTQSIAPATGKLLKLLKVPVVVVILKGSYYSQPRWSWTRRPGNMELEFKLIFNGSDLKKLSSESILDQLQTSMEYDEEKWRSLHPVRHKSAQRANHIELALYMCSNCEAIGSMRSLFNKNYCKACGHVLKLTKNYSFSHVGQCFPRFESIRAWNEWQAEAYKDLLSKAKQNTPVFSDSGVLLLKGDRIKPLLPLYRGNLVMYKDRLEFINMSGVKTLFFVNKIDGEGVLKQQLLEFYIDKNLYQIRFPGRFQSARKWADAISILKQASA